MLSFVFPLLLVSALFGQQASELFEKAPPQIDAALRARIAKFYQAHVDGKFRQAEAIAAEDSKDIYYSSDKSRYYSFEIVKISYSDNFTKATALVSCDSDFHAAGRRMRVKIPLTSLWKYENGDWWWYAVPRRDEVQTPFGVMHPGQGTDSLSAPIPDVNKAAQEILTKIRANKQEVELSSYQPATEEVVISNDLQGPVKLSLEYEPLPGFEAKLDRQEVSEHELARLRLTMQPKDKAAKPTMIVKVRVEPTGQIIPIKVTFAVPPEVQKLLPKK